MEPIRRRWYWLLATTVILLGLRPTPVPQPLVTATLSAVAAAEDGHLPAALQALEQVLAFDPRLIRVHVQAAQVALAAGDPNAALQHLTVVENLRPDDPDLPCLTGEALYALGDIRGALEAWQQSSTTCPQATLPLETVLHAYYQEEDFSAAREVLGLLVAQQPSNAQAVLQLGALIATDDPDQALSYLETGFALSGDAVGWAEDLISSIESTRELAETALRVADVGRVLADSGQWSLAARAFRNALTLKADYVEAQAYLGLALDQLGKDGLPELQAAVAAGPNVALPHLLLGMHWLSAGKPQDAIPELEAAYQLDPENPAAVAQLGAAYAAIDDLTAAETAFRQAAELQPDEPKFWLLLAHFSLDNEIKVSMIGLPAARNAVVLQPNDPAALEALGLAHLLSGTSSLAERFLWRSLDLDPMRASIQYYWGLLRLALGDTQRAIPALRLATQLDPDGPVGELASRSLENLGS